MNNKIFKQDLIGQGSFAKVFRAWDDQKQCQVAWKEMEHIELARKEATLLREMKHPLFPQYLDYWEENQKAILIMEYVYGENLEQFLARRGFVSEKICIEIALELADGLLYLHERKSSVVFRDLKPANIMIRQDGRVKLLDMGCACTGEEELKSYAGNVEYSPWEQFEAETPIGTYSDVYALGKVLQTMLHKEKGKDSGMMEITKMCTKETIGERLPDMRSVIAVLSAYNNFRSRKGILKKRNGANRAFIKKMAHNSIIYEKNVWKKSQSS